MTPDQLAAWVPAITAALTLSNAVFLWFVNQRTRKIKEETNGMKMQLLAEAEKRGARSARRRVNKRIVGD